MVKFYYPSGSAALDKDVMRRFEPNDKAIEIALPVLAVECEATPPIDNYLDAYEETVLKLVKMNLSANGISKTMSGNSKRERRAV